MMTKEKVMTRKEMAEDMYKIRQVLVLANKLHPTEETKETLVLATRLTFQLEKQYTW